MKMYIWDTAGKIYTKLNFYKGQEKYRSLAPIYYR